MPIYKITYSREKRYATLHNHGCNFRCKGCSYKLLGYEKPDSYPTLEQIKEALKGLDIERVYFKGGEPTINPQLPELLRFCKQELKVETRLGHTQGWNIPTENLDFANVTFKAYDPKLHLDYTGQPRGPVYVSFVRAYMAGVQMKAGAVFIPDYVGQDEIVRIASFVAGLDPEIPFHVMGYIDVPGGPFRRPTEPEMAAVVEAVKKILKNVTSSHYTCDEMLKWSERIRTTSCRIL